MGDTSNLAQKKRKLALEDDEEDDPSRTMTVRTANETHEKDEYKHKEEEKKIQKKPDGKAADDSKKQSKPEAKPKAQPEKSSAGEKKPEKSVDSKSTSKDAKSAQDKKKDTKKSAPPAKKHKKDESESESGSDDSSDDDDDSSGSDSSSESDKKKKKSKPPAKKSTPKKAVKGEEKTVKKTKDDLIYEVLKRWWYCMEEWPPKDFDYNKILREKGLRKVDFRTWKLQPEVEDGLTKVYEVHSYPGIFKNSKNEVFDLRPRDSCPCYETFKSKNVSELLTLLIKALKNQINALETSDNCDPTLLATLKKDLVKGERSLEAATLSSKKA